MKHLTPDDVYLGYGQAILIEQEILRFTPISEEGVCIAKPWLLNINPRSQVLAHNECQSVRKALTAYMFRRS